VTDYTDLHLRPLTLAQANDMVTTLHRHHKKATGHRFSIGVVDDSDRPRGAAIVGRPVARMTDQYNVAEVIRLVTDGTRNACSMLYAAACRAAKAMGYRHSQTFILDSEPGTSLKACGWRKLRDSSGGTWGRPSRGRVDAHPVEPKTLWVCPCYQEANDRKVDI
jgi:hypothetical protein